MPYTGLVCITDSELFLSQTPFTTFCFSSTALSRANTTTTAKFTELTELQATLSTVTLL